MFGSLVHLDAPLVEASRCQQIEEDLLHPFVRDLTLEEWLVLRLEDRLLLFRFFVVLLSPEELMLAQPGLV